MKRIKVNLKKMHNYNSYLILSLFAFLFSCLLLQATLTTGSLTTLPGKETGIGVILDQTSRPGKEAKVAIELAVEDLKIKTNQNSVLYIQNTRNKPVYAAIAAKQLIDKKNVKAIIGGHTWEEASAIAEVISEANHDIPVFLSLSGTTPLQATDQWPFFVQGVPTQSTQMNGVASILQSLGIRQVTLIYDTSSSASIISHLSQAVRQTGPELTHILPLSSSSISIEEELEVLKRQQRKVFVLHTSLELAIRLFQTAKKMEMTGDGYLWIATNAITDLFHSINSTMISSLKGMVGVKSYIQETTPDFINFKRRFRQKFHSDYPEEEHEDPGIFAVQGNNAMKMLGKNSPKNFHKWKPVEANIVEIVYVIGKGYQSVYWTEGSGFSETVEDDIKGPTNYTHFMDNVGQFLWPVQPWYANRRGRNLADTSQNRMRVGVPAKSLFTNTKMMMVNQIQWALPPQPLTHHPLRRSLDLSTCRRSHDQFAGLTFSSSRKYYYFAGCNCVSSSSSKSSGEIKGKSTVRSAAAYPFDEIENKWQLYWDENGTFRTPDIHEIDTHKPKFYVLDMFPYPSGAGLHVGHPLGYTATDILARFKRMQGFNVLHPMGWDAFGLPAEQYAIQTGTHPKTTTIQNIDRFRAQLKSLGFSYDWDREISTTQPDYYKWTQWIFLQLLKSGLAYQAEVPVNWCPALGTVLANEEVVDGVSERGGHPVIRKPMKQWMLKITAYADRLLEDLDALDWPESIKEMQRNWIGKSQGAEVEFCVLSRDGQVTDAKITIYTTRPDTIFGATYLVLAPEHPLLTSVVSEAQQNIVEEYKEVSSKKSDLERTELQKEKSGVFSGCYARNPVNGEAIPIWVADYVLGSYGTGAIMAVPAHDSRDYEFALKYNIPIHWVVTSDERSADFEKPYAGEGEVINSSSSTTGLNINGLRSKDAAGKVIEWVEKTGNGNRKVNYKLRDWLFARQRYWGEPIPVVFLDDNGETVPISETELPLTLPELDDFTPTGTGDPPLSKAVSWVKTVDSSSGKPARRETNTMPQWAGSCWYYLRFMDPKNSTQLVDKKKEMYWGPVDVYVGGAEHAVLHLLYSRFWHKVLYDIGVVSTKEPFKCVINQGIILGEVQYMACRDQDGNFVSADSVDASGEHKQERIPEENVIKSGNSFVLKDNPSIRLIARAHKMSKSRGNVVNPDDVVAAYGADSLRLYEMFMGPLRDSKTWNTSGIEGVHRFLGRSWRLIIGSPLPDGTYRNQTVAVDESPSLEQLKSLHRCIEKVTDEIEATRFNTGISAMMEFVNSATKWDKLPKSIAEPFILLVSPYAPHIAEELWFRLGHSTTLAYEPFPKANPAYLKDTTITLPVQINGKTRGTVQVEVTCTEDDAFKLASLDQKVSKYLDGKTVKKRVYVPGKILNVILERESSKVGSR